MSRNAIAFLIIGVIVGASYILTIPRTEEPTSTTVTTLEVTTTLPAATTSPSEAPTMPPETSTTQAATTTTQAATTTSTVFYEDCAAVLAAGASPLLAEAPGYRSELDPDGDGIACQFESG